MCHRSMKGKLVFFIGFLLGFSITLYIASNNNCATFNCQDKSSESIKLQFRSEKWIARGIFSNDKLNSNDIEDQQKFKYSQWLEKNRVSTTPVNLDTEKYQITDDKTPTTLESNWLNSKINIICIVFVKQVKLARAIKDTWGSRCNEVYFFSHKVADTQVPVHKLPLKITSSWQMLCEVMNDVWKSSNDTLEWVLFVRDNMMVLPENLRYFVAPLDPNNDYYLGHSILWWGQRYNVGEAGYVLSRGTLQKVIETFNSHEKCSSSGKYWRKEDYYLGKHLAALNIHPLDTRDYKLRDTFHGYSLQTLLWNVAKLGNYFTRALYPTGSFCCSPRSISFNIDEADKMHTTNYLLYHLYVYNVESCYGNKPAPTPVPENEIWRIALKDEFNMTDIKYMSAENYYSIWRKKYSKPSQFINQNQYQKYKNYNFRIEDFMPLKIINITNVTNNLSVVP